MDTEAWATLGWVVLLCVFLALASRDGWDVDYWEPPTWIVAGVLVAWLAGAILGGQYFASPENECQEVVRTRPDPYTGDYAEDCLDDYR